MFMSALLSFWSSAVFRGHPSTGFSVALLLFVAALAILMVLIQPASKADA